ncbi:MAG: dUTP diphosphatase [Acutalibacteraceae bacterium]|nr:dUTP diphosphatase [Acutalibacteraceae bacterium]
MVKVNFKKLDKNAHAPTYGSQFAAGADLYALTNGKTLRFAPGETKMIHTGLAVEIPEGYAGLVYARSGIATKRGLAPANKVGVIDSDYRGEVMVSLHNHSGAEQEIADGERIAQLVIAPFLAAEFCETDELSVTDRGEGGFGSTGKK